MMMRVQTKIKISAYIPLEIMYFSTKKFKGRGEGKERTNGRGRERDRGERREDKSKMGPLIC